MRTNQKIKVDNFERNAQGSHLVVQNEANEAKNLPPNKNILQNSCGYNNFVKKDKHKRLTQ